MTKDEIIHQRQRILELLYDARLTETRVRRGYVPEKDIADAVGKCAFNLGVLEELKQVQRDGYRWRITGPGVIACEENEDHPA